MQEETLLIIQRLFNKLCQNKFETYRPAAGNLNA